MDRDPESINDAVVNAECIADFHPVFNSVTLVVADTLRNNIPRANGQPVLECVSEPECFADSHKLAEPNAERVAIARRTDV